MDSFQFSAIVYHLLAMPNDIEHLNFPLYNSKLLSAYWDQMYQQNPQQNNLIIHEIFGQMNDQGFYPLFSLTEIDAFYAAGEPDKALIYSRLFVKTGKLFIHLPQPFFYGTKMTHWLNFPLSTEKIHTRFTDLILIVLPLEEMIEIVDLDHLIARPQIISSFYRLTRHPLYQQCKLQSKKYNLFKKRIHEGIDQAKLQHTSTILKTMCTFVPRVKKQAKRFEKLLGKQMKFI